MNLVDQFLWLIFPYIMLTLFIAGHIYRYNKDQFGWSAKSSEFLEKRSLRMASILFHWGIIVVFLGHVAGLIFPQTFYDKIGVTEKIYHLGAVFIGVSMGVVTLVGILLLVYRRLSVRRLSIHSNKGDWLTLILLVITIVTGFINTMGYTATDAGFDYRDSISPWFRGLLTFSPEPELMAGAPWSFQIHIFTGFLLFGFWPFIRLVHMWSLPLSYLKRRYIVYRSIRPNKI